MSYDVFGDLQEWGRDLDQVQEDAPGWNTRQPSADFGPLLPASPTRFLAMTEQVQLVTGEPLRGGSGDSDGGIVANIEKHLKHPMEQIDQADFSEVPTCGRSSRLIGHYIKNREDGARNHVLPVEERPQAILFRLDHTPATPPNLERLRERVRALNRRLADSGTPFRLRVV
ncbi:MAG: hypothetical protein ABI604_18635 [Nitrospirota bacterium]